MPKEDRTIIAVKDVQKSFKLGNQTVHALNDVSLTIPVGQFVAIMGPSGSGKSSLLYLLGALDQLDGGTITVAGHPIERMGNEERARFRRETIGFIFQAFHLVPTHTALENVAFPGIFAGIPRAEREERAYQLLKMLKMDERLDHKPSQLSGGQQQRVAIARALFNDPPIIMADEPTGALDSKMGQTVMKMLRTLSQQRNKTIVLVTHDPGVATFADRLIHLKDGRIDGDELLRPQELLNETSR